jgi:hypothetical protein
MLAITTLSYPMEWQIQKRTKLRIQEENSRRSKDSISRDGLRQREQDYIVVLKVSLPNKHKYTLAY